MSVAAVMLVKDEVDVIEHTVLHLLANDISEVIVADNISTDGTMDKLSALASQDDRVSLRTDEERGYYQGQKTTALAREALDHGHRWVIPCDADELWIAPEGRTLRDWLDAVGRETQFVKAAIYNHVATGLDFRAEDGQVFDIDKPHPEDRETVEPNPFKRLGWRQRVPLDIRWGKIACRLRPDLEIAQGNHEAKTMGTGTTGFGLEIRHFPYRSADHFIRKAINGYAAYQATDLDEGIGSHWRVYGRAIEEGGERAGAAWFYDAFWSDDPEHDDSLVFDPAPLAVPQ